METKLSSFLALLNSFRIRRSEFCNLFSLRIVNGEPTVTVRPNAALKFQRNQQAGVVGPTSRQLFKLKVHASTKKLCSIEYARP